MTREEELARWRDLRGRLQKTPTSAPNWFELADYCIAALIEDKIDSLKHNRDT